MAEPGSCARGGRAARDVLPGPHRAWATTHWGAPTNPPGHRRGARPAPRLLMARPCARLHPFCHHAALHEPPSAPRSCLAPDVAVGSCGCRTPCGPPLSVHPVTSIYVGLVALPAPRSGEPVTISGCRHWWPQPRPWAGGQLGSRGQRGGLQRVSLPATCGCKASSCPGPANVLLLGLFRSRTWSCFISV